MSGSRLLWGQGSTVYACAHCGRQLQSAWQRQPTPAVGQQVWRHAGTRRAACVNGSTSAAPR